MAHPPKPSFGLGKPARRGGDAQPSKPGGGPPPRPVLDPAQIAKKTGAKAVKNPAAMAAKKLPGVGILAGAAKAAKRVAGAPGRVAETARGVREEGVGRVAAGVGKSAVSGAAKVVSGGAKASARMARKAASKVSRHALRACLLSVYCAVAVGVAAAAFLFMVSMAVVVMLVLDEDAMHDVAEADTEIGAGSVYETAAYTANARTPTEDDIPARAAAEALTVVLSDATDTDEEDDPEEILRRRLFGYAGLFGAVVEIAERAPEHQQTDIPSLVQQTWEALTNSDTIPQDQMLWRAEVTVGWLGPRVSVSLARTTSCGWLADRANKAAEVLSTDAGESLFSVEWIREALSIEDFNKALSEVEKPEDDRVAHPLDFEIPVDPPELDPCDAMLAVDLLWSSAVSMSPPVSDMCPDIGPVFAARKTDGEHGCPEDPQVYETIVSQWPRHGRPMLAVALGLAALPVCSEDGPESGRTWWRSPYSGRLRTVAVAEWCDFGTEREFKPVDGTVLPAYAGPRCGELPAGVTHEDGGLICVESERAAKEAKDNAAEWPRWSPCVHEQYDDNIPGTLELNREGHTNDEEDSYRNRASSYLVYDEKPVEGVILYAQPCLPEDDHPKRMDTFNMHAELPPCTQSNQGLYEGLPYQLLAAPEGVVPPGGAHIGPPSAEHPDFAAPTPAPSVTIPTISPGGPPIPHDHADGEPPDAGSGGGLTDRVIHCQNPHGSCDAGIAEMAGEEDTEGPFTDDGDAHYCTPPGGSTTVCVTVAKSSDRDSIINAIYQNPVVAHTLITVTVAPAADPSSGGGSGDSSSSCCLTGTHTKEEARSLDQFCIAAPPTLCGEDAVYQVMTAIYLWSTGEWYLCGSTPQMIRELIRNAYWLPPAWPWPMPQAPEFGRLLGMLASYQSNDVGRPYMPGVSYAAADAIEWGIERLVGFTLFCSSSEEGMLKERLREIADMHPLNALQEAVADSGGGVTLTDVLSDLGSKIASPPEYDTERPCNLAAHPDKGIGTATKLLDALIEDGVCSSPSVSAACNELWTSLRTSDRAAARPDTVWHDYVVAVRGEGHGWVLAKSCESDPGRWERRGGRRDCIIGDSELTDYEERLWLTSIWRRTNPWTADPTGNMGSDEWIRSLWRTFGWKIGDECEIAGSVEDRVCGLEQKIHEYTTKCPTDLSEKIPAAEVEWRITGREFRPDQRAEVIYTPGPPLANEPALGSQFVRWCMMPELVWVLDAYHGSHDLAVPSGIRPGSVWRGDAHQVALRRGRCGGDADIDYCIYAKPSSEFAPPTAVPGTSRHQTGMASDFNRCQIQDSSCFRFLDVNAESRAALINFPVEPWHWSVDGG